MWYQKDWFTGSDYYNFRERQISVQELCIINPVEQVFHERTEFIMSEAERPQSGSTGKNLKSDKGVYSVCICICFIGLMRLRSHSIV